jgi:hypothetical protein
MQHHAAQDWSSDIDFPAWRFGSAGYIRKLANGRKEIDPELASATPMAFGVVTWLIMHKIGA